MRVLITGAAGGLGRALAAECASRGYDIFLTDVSLCGLEVIRRGLERQYGIQADIKACNLTDTKEVAELFSYIDGRSLRFDMLLNVAGVDYEGGFLDRECESLVGIVKLNIEATLRITHEILDGRAKQPFYLVFISSLASMYPMPLKATYAASKRFLLDFSIALGQELKEKGVKVMAVCPAGLPTTKEAMDGIAAQGFWGNATTCRLEIVARKTVSRVLGGRKLYVPGVLNRLLRFFGGLVPRAYLARLIYMRWRNAGNRRLSA